MTESSSNRPAHPDSVPGALNPRIDLADRTIYWIGGSPCAGKSTIADRLAAAYGMMIYRCDDAFFTHVERVDPARQPVFHQLAHATADELWLRPVGLQVEEEIALYREEFPMILDDLRALPENRPVIAEGAALLPELLRASGIDMGRAMWMVPAPAFQRRHYERRDWRHDVLRECTNPALGWENGMARDAAFAKEVVRQARARNLRLMTVDGSLTLEETLEIAGRWLGLPVR